MVKYSEMALFVAGQRGIVLNELIFMERCIDEIISKYFTDSETKRADLYNLILATNKITLNSKVLVLNFIIKHRYKEYAVNNSDIWDRLNKVIPERNRMAHYLLDTSDGWHERFLKENAFTLHNFDVGIIDSGVKEIKYTKERVYEVIKEIADLTNIFVDFRNKYMPLIDNSPPK